MSVSITCDSTKFQKAFRERVTRCHTSLDQCVNRAALEINKVAIKDCKRADRQQIEALGVAGYLVLKKAVKDPHGFMGKRGRGYLKNRKILYGDTDTIRMRPIYIAYLRGKGVNPESISKGDMELRIKKALGRRLAAVGSVASSFIPILRKIVDSLKAGDVKIEGALSGFNKDLSGVGTGKGGATPAKPGWKPICTFEVRPIQSESPASDERQIKTIEKAMQNGFNGAAANLEKFTTETLNKIWQS